jgi:hypothetical protein
MTGVILTLFLAGMTGLALGFGVGGQAGRVCHIIAAVFFGVATILTLI